MTHIQNREYSQIQKQGAPTLEGSALWEGLERKKIEELSLERVYGKKLVEIYTVGVSRGQRKSASWERPEELRRWRQKRKKPIRPQAGWYSVDMVLLLATAVDFEPRTDTWVPEDESLLERRVAN